MTDYAFRLLNVFATNDSAFSGNQLCVFEDARGLDDAVMLQLAAQFNLSKPPSSCRPSRRMRACASSRPATK